jgi:hypothetical protein
MLVAEQLEPASVVEHKIIVVLSTQVTLGQLLFEYETFLP